MNKRKLWLHNCFKGKSDLGRVIDTTEKASGALKTVMRRHEFGVSITYFRLFFTMCNGKRVKDSDVWVMQRHMEFHGEASIDIQGDTNA